MSLAAAAGHRQRIRSFRRIAGVTTAIVGVGLLIGTGFTFLNTNGTADTTIKAAAESGDVYASGASPTNVLWNISGNATGPTAPGWTPTVGTVNTVATAGDVAIVDTTQSTADVLVTLSLTNPAALSADYSYMNLPISVSACKVVNTACLWGAVTADANGAAIAAPTYLTLTNGYVTFLLSGGQYYELTIPTGGSMYTVSSTASGGSLSPNFLVTTQVA